MSKVVFKEIHKQYTARNNFTLRNKRISFKNETIFFSSTAQLRFCQIVLRHGRGGAVVRALAFYTDAPSSIPGKGKNQAIGRSPVDPAVNGYLVL